MIPGNLAKIRERINEAANRSGRSAKDVTLVAVAKGQPTELILEAVQAGQTDFGENYAQEMLAHSTQLSALRQKLTADCRELHLHFIGRLQRNKVRQIIDKVALIHSVDSPELAREIAVRAAQIGKIQPILIEVNLGGEETKSGVGETDAAKLAAELGNLDHLDLKGLMVIPPYHPDPERSRPFFRRLREIRDAFNEKKVYKRPLTELSMGMTHDFEVAIEEGATIVRIGTAIFGPRGENDGGRQGERGFSP